jgi:hypothetical protein
MKGAQHGVHGTSPVAGTAAIFTPGAEPTCPWPSTTTDDARRLRDAGACHPEANTNGLANCVRTQENCWPFHAAQPTSRTGSKAGSRLFLKSKPDPRSSCSLRGPNLLRGGPSSGNPAPPLTGGPMPSGPVGRLIGRPDNLEKTPPAAGPRGRSPIPPRSPSSRRPNGPPGPRGGPGLKVFRRCRVCKGICIYKDPSDLASFELLIVSVQSTMAVHTSKRSCFKASNSFCN